MGLDMNVYIVPKEAKISGVEVDKKQFNNFTHLWYWRKHHDLHGWMDQLYIKKGGQHEFNCEYVELTNEDLDQLERDIKEFNLPRTTGFFFGHNPPDDESVAEDLEFVAAARKVLLTTTNHVYYCSWW